MTGPQSSSINDSGRSLRECQEKFGFSRRSWDSAVKRSVIVPRPAAMPLAKLLALGERRNRGNLKQRLISAGLKQCRCEECGLSEWQGQPLSLALHHINGDGCDNRIENLVLLCPNCHSQTPNFSGKNCRRVRAGREASSADATEAA